MRFPIRSGLLARRTGVVHAVEDVSLAISAGETLGLVGESGSGKSTIGRAIINLEDIHSGKVLLAGKQVDYGSRAGLLALRREVQMIFQDPYGSLDSRQTIGDAIMEPMIFHRLARSGRSAQADEGAPGAGRTEPRTTPGACRMSSRAGSASGSASPGRWPCSRA